uniref:Uncharacterized protein n=1 Tax=Arundo donax TaxID=35708 RepID=A0A0A9G3G3_ARUDO
MGICTSNPKYCAGFPPLCCNEINCPLSPHRRQPSPPTCPLQPPLVPVQARARAIPLSPRALLTSASHRSSLPVRDLPLSPLDGMHMEVELFLLDHGGYL